MVTNQMTHEAAMAVSIIDQIEGKDVNSVSMERNKIVMSQNNRIIAQWTGETWVLGTILKSVLPIYEDNCIHVINACTRLHRRASDYKDSTSKNAAIDHSIRMIRHHMDTTGVETLSFSGSVNNNWSPSVSYILSRTKGKGSTTRKKQMYQLYQRTKSNNVVSKVDYGFGTCLIGWIDIATNKVSVATSLIKYIDKWSLKGTKEIVKDDVLRQIVEFNNTKKR